MSRATEIALALIILQASIGFVDAIQMFDTTYTAPVQNNASDYNISYLSEYSTDINDPDWLDTLSAGIDLFIGTFLIGFKIVFSIIFIFPTLVDRFSVPSALSAFIQVGIYFCYATWYAQYKSNKGWSQYE